MKKGIYDYSSRTGGILQSKKKDSIADIAESKTNKKRINKHLTYIINMRSE